MGKRIAVLATGGVGSVLGGMLTRAGHDVTMIDQWPAHVEAMKANGIRIGMGGFYEDGELQNLDADYRVQVRAVHLVDVCSLREKWDIVFLTSKSYDTKWLTQFIEPYLSPDGYLVSVQNSYNVEQILPILGAERTLGCILNAGGWLMEPGLVWRTKPPEFPDVYNVGEVDGSITPRIQELAEIMSTASKTKVHTNILGVIWAKLVHNTMTGPITGLTNKRTAEVWGHPKTQPIVAHLGREAIAVGKALGFKIEPIFQLTTEDFMQAPEEIAKKIAWASTIGVAIGYPTMVRQDIMRGRPSEVMNHLNGLIVRKGREVGVPTPMNEAILKVWARLESGEIKQGVETLDLIELPEEVAQAAPVPVA